MMLFTTLSDLSKTTLIFALLGVLGAGSVFYVGIQTSLAFLTELILSSGYCNYHL